MVSIFTFFLYTDRSVKFHQQFDNMNQLYFFFLQPAGVLNVI